MSSSSNNIGETRDGASQSRPAQLPVATPDAPDNWRGMTLEELRRARGKALVRREVERATLQYNIDGVKSNVAANGVRALMFTRNRHTPENGRLCAAGLQAHTLAHGPAQQPPSPPLRGQNIKKTGKKSLFFEKMSLFF